MSLVSVFLLDEENTDSEIIKRSSASGQCFVSHMLKVKAVLLAPKHQDNLNLLNYTLQHHNTPYLSDRVPLKAGVRLSRQ